MVMVYGITSCHIIGLWYIPHVLWLWFMVYTAQYIYCVIDWLIAHGILSG